MSERSASPAAPPRRTLMAPPAALARVQKVLPVELAVPPRPAVQHAADKSAKKPPIVRRPQVGEDPAALAERRARLARRNALFLKLRAISPALFAAIPAPPMAIGIYDVLVGRLGLDPEGKADLRRIISEHVNRPGYQRVLTAERD